MKILHIQLAGPFTDGMGYQENILTRLHHDMGNEVRIITSRMTVKIGHGLVLTDSGQFVTGTGIPFIRIPYTKWLPVSIAKKVRVFSGYKKYIEAFNPDIIFVHDIMFFWVQDLIRFLREHPQTRVYVDSHTDQINSAKTWFSRNILHKIIIRYLCVKPLDRYVRRYWGTLPARMLFYQKFYHVSPKKTSLLPMGLDDAEVDFSKKDEYRKTIRERYHINDNVFLVLTGGKIEKRKRLSLLVEAINKIDDPSIKLIIFGTPNKEIEKEYESWKENPRVICIGWIDYRDIYQYCVAADIAVFPGTHSVIWEQVVGSGLVGIFQRWEGFQHIDINGNCLICDFKNSNDIINTIQSLKKDKALFAKMKALTQEASSHFQYSTIAKHCIEQPD